MDDKWESNIDDDGVHDDIEALEQKLELYKTRYEKLKSMFGSAVYRSGKGHFWRLEIFNTASVELDFDKTIDNLTANMATNTVAEQEGREDG